MDLSWHKSRYPCDVCWDKASRMRDHDMHFLARQYHLVHYFQFGWHFETVMRDSYSMDLVSKFPRVAMRSNGLMIFAIPEHHMMMLGYCKNHQPVRSHTPLKCQSGGDFLRMWEWYFPDVNVHFMVLTLRLLCLVYVLVVLPHSQILHSLNVNGFIVIILRLQ